MTEEKRAFITGITGQDGSYLTELLLEKGYQVFGLMRRTATPSTRNIEHLKGNIEIVKGDLTDPNSLKAIGSIKPHEVYNLAAQSHVGRSFSEEASTTMVNYIGTINLLAAVRTGAQTARFYQASTSELFGSSVNGVGFQNEDTPFNPQSPYAISKQAAHQLVRLYREGTGNFACSGILFNHESPRRGEEFVTRKITKALSAISLGLQNRLSLGNMEAHRDWGFAGDYVLAMWLMLQQDAPKDYVIATGETHSVREFVVAAAKSAGFCLGWQGEGTEEVGIDMISGKTIVDINPKFYRPTDVEFLKGDSRRAREELGWQPEIDFQGLVDMMVDADKKLLQRNLLEQRVERLEDQMGELKGGS